MSFDLRQILRHVAEEDYESEEEAMERGLDRYKTLLLEIARVKSFDLAISVEGSEAGFQKAERDLSVLERANLVKGEMNYTHHNAYREYRLTKKGTELATRLLKEKNTMSIESQPNF
jgi:hypothetical protein